MISQKITVNNPSGLHLRPAGILCNEAIKYSSAITFTFEGGTANAKSVLSVLGACVKCGDEIELVCEGADEQEALKALTRTNQAITESSIKEFIEELNVSEDIKKELRAITPHTYTGL